MHHPEHGIAPTSERILQDASRVLDATAEIVQARGTAIADMNDRTGKRRETSVSASTNWGGARKRKLKEDDHGKMGHCMMMQSLQLK